MAKNLTEIMDSMGNTGTEVFPMQMLYTIQDTDGCIWKMVYDVTNPVDLATITMHVINKGQTIIKATPATPSDIKRVYG